jgi:hypothetical protein
MSSPIAKYLDKLIDDADEGVAQVQLLFAPGVKVQAGGVRRCEAADGLYEFCTPVQATEDLDDGTKAGQTIVVNIVFDPTSILQVITQMETSGIIQPLAS